MVRVCDSNIIFPCVCPCIRRPSICLSRYLLPNLQAEFNQTFCITSPHVKGVREQHYFVGAFVLQCVHRPSIRPSRYLFLNLQAEFNQTFCITSPMVKVCESNITGFSVRSSVHVSIFFTICPSRYLLLNHLSRIQPNLQHHFPSR